ncbi:SitI3 family protein [Kitasatospora sp. NPDC051984]|uniref:SitI3 family protein n=1 Tax=Kitasatospora sp. NPDC051984 TaxID=3364059 RepID=UPI0037C67A7E
MTIAHQLYLATEEPAEQIAARVSRLYREKGLSEEPPALGELLDVSGAATARGTRIHVSAPSGYPVDIVDREFGVPSKIELWIEPARYEPPGPQEEDIIALVLGLLAELPVDAVLTYNYETVWLLRRGEDLVLHEDPLMWPEHWRAMIDGPYRRESLRF